MMSHQEKYDVWPSESSRLQEVIAPPPTAFLHVCFSGSRLSSELAKEGAQLQIWREKFEDRCGMCTGQFGQLSVSRDGTIGYSVLCGV